MKLGYVFQEISETVFGRMKKTLMALLQYVSH